MPSGPNGRRKDAYNIPEQVQLLYSALVTCYTVIMRYNWDGFPIRELAEDHGTVTSLITALGFSQHNSRARASLNAYLDSQGVLLRGNRRYSNGNRRLSSEVFVEGKEENGRKLKERLVGDGHVSYECSECGIAEWQGKALVLHIDHIDGNRVNNRVENLRLLCPNCHSQTDTYCAKNRKKKQA